MAGWDTTVSGWWCVVWSKANKCENDFMGHFVLQFLTCIGYLTMHEINTSISNCKKTLTLGTNLTEKVEYETQNNRITPETRGLNRGGKNKNFT